jgi:hypothetical protein
MAYDFSKKTVSVKELSKKRSDAVAKSRSKSKSTNESIDNEPVDTQKAGISESWNKDTVTLAEARQQSREAGSYLQKRDQEYRESRGIVQTVDTQKAGISESWNKDTVTLAEARAQTGEAQRYIDAKTDQTNESMNDQDDVDQRELPEYIDKDSELGRAAVASGLYRVTERTGPSTVEIIRGMQPGGDRLERMAALLGVRGESSGSGDYGTDVSKGPLYVKTVTDGKSISQQVQGLFREGQEAGRGEGGISLQLDRNDYSTTSGLYERAEGAAGFVVDKFDTSTQKVVDKIPVPTIRKGVDTLQNVSVGAIEAVAGTVPLVAGVPMVGEVLIKEPKKFAQAIPIGLGLMTEAGKQAAKDDPARLAGNIAGGILLGKASLKGAGSIGKGKVATGEIKSFKVDTPIKGSGLDIAPSVPSTAKPVTMADAIFGKPTIRLRESVPVKKDVYDALPFGASPTGPYKPVKSILRDEIRNVVNKYPGGKQKVRPSREPRGLTPVQPKKQPTWYSDQMEPVMPKRRPGEIPRDMPFDEPPVNVRVKKFIDQKYPTPNIAGGAKGKKFKTSADIFKPVKDTGVSTPSGSGGQMLLQVQKVRQVPKVTRISEVAKTKSKAKTKQVQKIRQKQATKQKTRLILVPKIASRAMAAIVPVQTVSTGSAQEILQVPVQKQEQNPIQKQKVRQVPKQKIMQDEMLDRMPITEVVEKQMIRPHRKRKLLTIEGFRDPKKKSRKKSGKSYKVGGKVKKQQWYNPMDISFGEVR